MEKKKLLFEYNIGNQAYMNWHCVGCLPRKMRTCFVVVVNFILLGLAMLTWLMQHHRSPGHHHLVIEDYITIILLVFTAATILILLLDRCKRTNK